MIDFKNPKGTTPIELDEAGGLLLTHITTQGELNRWEQKNIVEALTWIEKTKPTDILNEQFIKQLHKKMFGNVWKWAGRFRQSDKNIGVSWHEIPTNIRNLCDDVPEWKWTPFTPYDKHFFRKRPAWLAFYPGWPGFINSNRDQTQIHQSSSSSRQWEPCSPFGIC